MNCSQWRLDAMTIAFLAVTMQTVATFAAAGAEATACTAAKARKGDAQLEDHGCTNTAEGGGAAANGAASALLSQMSLRHVGDKRNPVVMESEEVVGIDSRNTSTITEEQEQHPTSQVPEALKQEMSDRALPNETQTVAPQAVGSAIPPQPPLGPAVLGLPMNSIKPPNTSDASSDGTALAASDGIAAMQPPLNDTQTPSSAESLAASKPAAVNTGTNTPADADNSSGAAATAAVAVADAAVAPSQPPVNATQPFDTRNTADSGAAATALAADSDGRRHAEAATTDDASFPSKMEMEMDASGVGATLQDTAEASDTSVVTDANASHTDLDTGRDAGSPSNTAVAEVATDAAAVVEPPVVAGDDETGQVDADTKNDASGAGATLSPTTEALDTSDVTDASDSHTDDDTSSGAGNPANTVAAAVAVGANAEAEPPANDTNLASSADASSFDTGPAASNGATASTDSSHMNTAALQPSSEWNRLVNTSSASSEDPPLPSMDTANDPNATAGVKDATTYSAAAAAASETSISSDAAVPDSTIVTTEEFSLAATHLLNMMQSVARSKTATTSLLSMVPQWMKPPLELLHEIVLQPTPQEPPNPDGDSVPPAQEVFSDTFPHFVWFLLIGNQLFVTLLAFFYWVHGAETLPEAGGVANPSDFDHWRSGICCRECSQDCWVRCCVAFCVPSVRWADSVRRLGFTGFWFAFAVFCICRLFSTIGGPGPTEWLMLTVICTGMRQEMRSAYGFQDKGGWTWVSDCLIIWFCFPCALIQEAEQADAAFRVGLPVAVRPVWKKLPYPAAEGECCAWYEQRGSFPKFGNDANSGATAVATKGDTTA